MADAVEKLDNSIKPIDTCPIR